MNLIISDQIFSPNDKILNLDTDGDVICEMQIEKITATRLTLWLLLNGIKTNKTAMGLKVFERSVNNNLIIKSC